MISLLYGRAGQPLNHVHILCSLTSNFLMIPPSGSLTVLCVLRATQSALAQLEGTSDFWQGHRHRLFLPPPPCPEPAALPGPPFRLSAGSACCPSKSAESASIREGWGRVKKKAAEIKGPFRFNCCSEAFVQGNQVPRCAG